MESERPKSLRATGAVLIVGALMLGSAGASAAATPKGRWPVAVEVVKEGRIEIARGERRQVVDLTREISGCKGGTFDPSTQEKYPGGPTVEVVDETEKASFTYVLLLASAPPNCNVQGECGAGGEDSTLVWLKIDKELAVADRQAFAISECRAQRSAKVARATEPDDPHFGTIQAKDLPWSGDVLRIEYQEREGAPRHLSYDRRSPNAGLQIQP
jgi:hypothetical protein